MEANESKMVRFTEDQVILQQGSTEKVLYKIIHGKAIVYLNYGQEDEYTVVAYSDVLLLRIPEEDFDDFIRNNSANAIGIMRNLANTLVTLSFNINLILEELEQGKKIEPEKYKDITRKIQYCTALDPENQFRFTSSV